MLFDRVQKEAVTCGGDFRKECFVVAFQAENGVLLCHLLSFDDCPVFPFIVKPSVLRCYEFPNDRTP